MKDLSPQEQKIMDVFRDKFPAARNGDYTEVPRPAIAAFLLQTIREIRAERDKEVIKIINGCTIDPQSPSNMSALFLLGEEEEVHIKIWNGALEETLSHFTPTNHE
jgi:hypothetical protein